MLARYIGFRERKPHFACALYYFFVALTAPSSDFFYRREEPLVFIIYIVAENVKFCGAIICIVVRRDLDTADYSDIEIAVCPADAAGKDVDSVCFTRSRQTNGSLDARSRSRTSGRSGARSAITPRASCRYRYDIISAVRANTEIPLIVGGGIQSVVMFDDAISAGADIIVVGNHLENHPEDMIPFAKFIKSSGNYSDRKSVV